MVNTSRPYRTLALAVGAVLIGVLVGESMLREFVAKPLAIATFFDSAPFASDQQSVRADEQFPIVNLGNGLLPTCTVLCFSSLDDYSNTGIVLGLTPAQPSVRYVRILDRCDIEVCDSIGGEFFRDARDEEQALLSTAATVTKCVDTTTLFYQTRWCRSATLLAGHVARVHHNLLIGNPFFSFWNSSEYQRVAGFHIDRASGEVSREEL